MPRQKRNRRIANPPHFKGFMPIGLPNASAPVLLNFEEYEGIRLCDSELITQAEAAKLMGVSRPTFTRIYESARRKIALAFIEGKPIVFEGGKVYFDSEWFICHACSCWFNHPLGEEKVQACALCGSERIEQCNEDNKPA